MTNEEQRRIFGKNLSYYVSLTGKSQKDVAKDLDVNYTTFNMWCLGKSMPTMGKVQSIADYFHIKNTDLIDDHDTNELLYQLAYDSVYYQKINNLNDEGKAKLYDYVDLLYPIYKKANAPDSYEASTEKQTANVVHINQNHLMPNAAHEVSPTPEQKKHADEIMFNDDEWK